MAYNDKKIRNITGVCVRNLSLRHGKRARAGSIYDYSRLIAVNDDRLVDSFFTLEAMDGRLIYVSEVVAASMSPNFGNVQIDDTKKHNSSRLKVKIWVRQQGWVLFLQWNTDLRHLRLIGDSIDDLDDKFADNSVIFRLDCRYYTSSRNVADIAAYDPPHTAHPTRSYSFDLIRSINNLDKSIRELKASKKVIARSIAQKKHNLHNHNNEFFARERSRIHMGLEDLDKAVGSQRKAVNVLNSQISTINVAIHNIHEITTDVRPSIQNSMSHEVEYVRNQVPSVWESLRDSYPMLQQSFRRLGTVIAEVIAIDKRDNEWRLSIMGNEFPQSIKELLDVVYYDKYPLQSVHPTEDSPQHRVAQVNAGLGYIAQTVVVLASILEVKVFYGLRHNGEFWTVKDFNDNQYPLAYDGSQTASVRNGNAVVLQNEPFEKGLSFLNKNILLIVDSLNDILHAFDPTHPSVVNSIPIECLDNFVWSIHYILLFLTAS